MQGCLLEGPLIIIDDDDRAEVGIDVVVDLVLEKELLEESLLCRPLEPRAAKISHRPHERRRSWRLSVRAILHTAVKDCTRDPFPKKQEL